MIAISTTYFSLLYGEKIETGTRGVVFCFHFAAEASALRASQAGVQNGSKLPGQEIAS